MINTKEIKIFLGSSIYDFKNERNEFKNFIFETSASFEKNYNVKLVPLTCEGVDPVMTKKRKQEKLNDLVRQSDICIFMFNKRVGKFTEEEFDLAYNTFKVNDKPIIYPYFKVIGEGEAEESLVKFKQKLTETYEQYPIDFEHIDTIEKQLLLTLSETELKGRLEIKLEGDMILVDGKEILSTENIAEFANNHLLKQLADELQQADSRYAELDGKFRNRLCTAEEETEYFEVAPKRRKLETQIEDLRKTIFNMSLRMCRDEIRGEITQLQRQAYRLFEAGKLEEANKILNPDQITAEYEQRTANRTAEQKKDAQVYISQLRTKIDILSAMVYNDNRFNEIEDIYDQITKVAFEQKVDLDIVYDFACFLYWQNNHKKAYKIAKQLEALMSDANQAETARVYHLLATVSAEFWVIIY